MNRPQHGGNLNWAASIAGCPVSALTDFSASINPLGTPPSAIAAIVNSTSQLNAYPDPEYPELRSHLAKHHQIDPNFILPGNGSAELLTWAGRELAQQNFTYLITPAFSDYARALNAFDGKILSCPLSLIRLAQCDRISPPSPPNLGGRKIKKSPKFGGFRGRVRKSYFKKGFLQGRFANRPYHTHTVVTPSPIWTFAEQSPQPNGQIMDERGDIALS